MVAGNVCVCLFGFRLAEAYGLWKEKAWAEWLALVSGAIYVPVEIYELAKKVTWIRAGALITNLVIVAFMAHILWRSKRRKLEEAAAAATAASGGPATEKRP